jgi:hypothetical protein
MFSQQAFCTPTTPIGIVYPSGEYVLPAGLLYSQLRSCTPSYVFLSQYQSFTLVLHVSDGVLELLQSIYSTCWSPACTELAPRGPGWGAASCGFLLECSNVGIASTTCTAQVPLGVIGCLVVELFYHRISPFTIGAGKMNYCTVILLHLLYCKATRNSIGPRQRNTFNQ